MFRVILTVLNSKLTNLGRAQFVMELNMQKIKTQDETEEPAAIDQANQRVEAQMKDIEKETKEQVTQGLRDQILEEHPSQAKPKKD